MKKSNDRLVDKKDGNTMAWNEPGGSGKDPWGQGSKGQQGPPDLDEIVRNVQKKLSALFGGGKGGGEGGGNGKGGGGKFSPQAVGGAGLLLIVVVALGLWIASGFYIVEQGERGVVLRFGAYTEATEAGLRWHIPWPIESKEIVNVQNTYNIEVGYRSNPRTDAKSTVPREALMLTQDENIIDIEFAVQYKIKDAVDYSFNVRNPEATIRQATESAVREIAGKSTMDFVLTEGRDEVGQRTQELLQKILDDYKSGIFIYKVEMQKAYPPEEVKAAFDDAVKAREDQERFKNEAEAYANDIIPRARGKATRMLQEADGHKASVIARAEGDARRFKQIAREYAKAPRVTRDRLYIEAMESVLSSTTKIFIDQKAGNNLLYLPLDKLVPQMKSPTEEEVSGSGATGPNDTSTIKRGRTRSDSRSRRMQ
jgi:modulator of FtsH protease HflK